MKNYVIYNSEGDVRVSSLTDEELDKRIAEEYWGDVGVLTHVPTHDTNYWGDNILIIRGEVVDMSAVLALKEVAKLNAERIEKEKRDTALAKLSPEDRKVLGL